MILITFQLSENILAIQDEKWLVVSDTANSSWSHILTDLWTLIRIQHCSKLLLTLLKQHFVTW
jgi:hypothetical protein